MIYELIDLIKDLEPFHTREDSWSDLRFDFFKVKNQILLEVTVNGDIVLFAYGYFVEERSNKNNNMIEIEIMNMDGHSTKVKIPEDFILHSDSDPALFMESNPLYYQNGKQVDKLVIQKNDIRAKMNKAF